MTQPLTPRAPVSPSVHLRPGTSDCTSAAVTGHPRLGRCVVRVFLTADAAEAWANRMAAELGVAVELVEASPADDWLFGAADIFADLPPAEACPAADSAYPAPTSIASNDVGSAEVTHHG